jgi:hypothetical protein
MIDSARDTGVHVGKELDHYRQFVLRGLSPWFCPSAQERCNPSIGWCQYADLNKVIGVALWPNDSVEVSFNSRVNGGLGSWRPSYFVIDPESLGFVRRQEVLKITLWQIVMAFCRHV